MLFLLELCLAIAAVFVACVRPEAGSKWFDSVERNFSTLARRRRLSVFLVGLLALAGRAAVLPILPVPVPQIDDEFGYLLAGETFARGRLTNPTPPMWQHFETFGQILRPTYQSKEPPAQGMVLAFGDIVAHQPFVGVWLSVGLMCAAFCWMLQGWLPPEWALLGGLIAVLRWGGVQLLGKQLLGRSSRGNGWRTAAGLAAKNFEVGEDERCSPHGHRPSDLGQRPPV